MSRLQRILTLIGAVLCLAAGFGVLAWAGLPDRADYVSYGFIEGRPVAPEVAAIAPPFELTSLSGEPIDLTALRGDPVVINFWATWCEPCEIEMPDLQAVYEQYNDDGLHLLAVNMGETAAQVRPWLDARGLTFPALLDQQNAVGALYQLRAQPSTFVIDQEGIIQEIFYGPVTARRLEAALQPLLAS